MVEKSKKQKEVMKIKREKERAKKEEQERKEYVRLKAKFDRESKNGSL